VQPWPVCRSHLSWKELTRTGQLSIVQNGWDADAPAPARGPHGLRVPDGIVLAALRYNEPPSGVESLTDELRLPVSSAAATRLNIRKCGWPEERADGREVTVQGRNIPEKHERLTDVLNAWPVNALDPEWGCSRRVETSSTLTL
jgi:hypothetical protein